ncbi:MAG: hypothetical protein ISR65_19860 [Bacteriovoracaceae bacterium]|nr:hypothetical protein [Bacteriovoracaceae bacterium]
MVRQIGQKKKEYKKPADYPQLAFRLDSDTKEEILSSIDELVDLLNEKREDDSYVIRKNDVFVEAIREGIKALKKKHIK